MSAMASTTPSTAMDRNLLDYRASQSWEDLMYEEQRGKKPWRKVSLALFLCLAGASMLIAGICLWYKGPGQGSATALLVLGSLCFLPGFYHTRIAYLAWKGVQGYSLDAIPDL